MEREHSHSGATAWQHDHTFGQDVERPGERRTRIVIALTAVMMIVEIGAGVAFGSMALLADGLHMASHACALTISAFAYIYTRRNARNPDFSFGAGKMNSLGGFTGAVLLAVFALMMGFESIERFFSPVGIAFNQAIGVAVVGLVVNGACALILGHQHDHHGPGDAHDHEHDHEHRHTADHGHDHNLRSAYLHVVADALTSVLAIVALLAGKYFGLNWMDPAMGVLGALLVARWSIGLLRTTSAVLLDKQAPAAVRRELRHALEHDEHTHVADLHVWEVAPGLYSLEAALVTAAPRTPDFYKSLLPTNVALVHRTVEVNQRA